MSEQPVAPDVLEVIGSTALTIPLFTIAAYMIPVLALTNPPVIFGFRRKSQRIEK